MTSEVSDAAEYGDVTHVSSSGDVTAAGCDVTGAVARREGGWTGGLEAAVATHSSYRGGEICCQVVKKTDVE